MAEDSKPYRLSATTDLTDEDNEKWRVTISGNSFTELEYWMQQFKEFKAKIGLTSELSVGPNPVERR